MPADRNRVSVEVGPERWTPDRLEGEALSGRLGRSPEDWVQEIKELLQRGRGRTLELATLLHRAKSKLRFGQWTELWRTGQIPLSKRKAEVLVAIGKSLGSLDAQDSAHLPSAWSTLYVLAQLDQRSLLDLIGKGLVHPGLTTAEAKALLPGCRSARQEPSSRLAMKRLLGRLRGHLGSELPGWSEADWQWLTSSLREISDLASDFPPSPEPEPAIHV
jgi:hypothetical protein